MPSFDLGEYDTENGGKLDPKFCPSPYAESDAVLDRLASFKHLIRVNSPFPVIKTSRHKETLDLVSFIFP